MAEANEPNRLATVVRSAAKVLTGFPSILAGVFAYGAVVLMTGGYSAIAGAVALSILMLPTIMLTAEDALRMVPAKMKEAAVGMGATKTQTVLMVLLPTAFPGILTGIMLAVARAAGETAPLLFTALFSNYWPTSGGRLNLMQPTASLAVLIYNFAGMPFKNQVEMAWAAALVMVLMVLITNLIGQSLSRRQTQQ
jgi:phosphate transport system permease protein